METYKFLQMLTMGEKDPEVRGRIFAYLDENKHPITAASLKLIAETRWRKFDQTNA